LNNLKNQNKTKSTIIILDGINDVGNFGAILRSALMFDVQGIILPKKNSTPINDAVIKSSSGAVFQLDIVYVTNIVRTIQSLKNIGYWFYATDKTGENISKINFNEKSVIIFGSENKGIRQLVKKNCDYTVSIKTNNKIDSLNLSVSTGIILYEISKNNLK
jgi:23S rRNA (guanosine2251-2'-O)-methyltransferase